jgi:flagellar hook assembly protein FlgD
MVPSTFQLYEPFPNPFNPTTTIRFYIGVGTTGLLTLQVYDITGRVVETLIDDFIESGNHEITWNAKQQSSGIFFVKLKSGGKSQTHKIIYLK